MNNTKWIAIGIGGVVILGAAVFFIFSGGGGISISSGQSIKIEFAELNQQVFAGDPFTVGASFANVSDRPLKDVVLSVSLPDGVSLLGEGGDQRIVEQSLGDLNQGSISKRDFDLIALGNGRTLKTLAVKLVYGIEGSKAKFQQEAAFDIAVGQPAVSLDFGVPQNIFNGENFDIAVRYRNATDKDITNLVLKVDYPAGFQFQKSDPVIKDSKNQWKIPEIKKLSNGVVTITGSLIGPEQSFFAFKAALLGESFGKEYTVVSQSANVAIATSPLSLSIDLNNTPNYVSMIGDNLTYTINYKNNSEITFENITIQANLSGELYDFATVSTEGSLNSIKNTITWLTANMPALQRLAPGEYGSVSFSVSLKEQFPIQRLSDKNYLLKVKAQIESPTVPEKTTAEKTTSVAQIETKVRGKIEIDAQAYFRDAASGILNSGAYPPRVNQPTQYTVHWIIKNYAADMSNIRVSGFLLSGSQWTGKVKSNVASVPKYNPTTGEVTWEIPFIQATKGVIGSPVETIFQIENTPAVNQVGQSVFILSETKLGAQDNFVSLPATAFDGQLGNDIPDDKTVDDTSRRVEP